MRWYKARRSKAALPATAGELADAGFPPPPQWRTHLYTVCAASCIMSSTRSRPNLVAATTTGVQDARAKTSSKHNPCARARARLTSIGAGRKVAALRCSSSSLPALRTSPSPSPVAKQQARTATGSRAAGSAGGRGQESSSAAARRRARPAAPSGSSGARSEGSRVWASPRRRAGAAGSSGSHVQSSHPHAQHVAVAPPGRAGPLRRRRAFLDTRRQAGWLAPGRQAGRRPTRHSPTC